MREHNLILCCETCVYQATLFLAFVKLSIKNTLDKDMIARTCGGMLMTGGHVMSTGMVKGASQALGLRAEAEDIGKVSP